LCIRGIHLDKRIVEIVSEASSELKQIMQQNIHEGKKFVPNAPATIRRKGFDHPLYEHGDLVNSITYDIIDESNQVTGRIGVFNPELAEIALINEFGTDKIPSRPFLRIAFDENIDRISNQITNKIFDYIEEVIKE